MRLCADRWPTSVDRRETLEGRAQGISVLEISSLLELSHEAAVFELRPGNNRYECPSGVSPQDATPRPSGCRLAFAALCCGAACQSVAARLLAADRPTAREIRALRSDGMMRAEFAESVTTSWRDRFRPWAHA